MALLSICWKLFENIFKKVFAFGGLKNIPVAICLTFGMRISKKTCSIGFEKMLLILKHRSLLT